jgi:hypothetical protein
VSEAAWIRSALRVYRLLDDTGTSDSEQLVTRRARLRSVREDWIVSQLSYFRLASRRYVAAGRYFIALAWISGAIGFATAAFASISVGRSGWTAVTADGSANVWWTPAVIVIFLTAFGAALFSSYANRLAFDQRANRYRRLESLYAKGSALLEAILNREPFAEADYGEAQMVIRELGTETLREYSFWMGQDREPRIDFVQSG